MRYRRSLPGEVPFLYETTCSLERCLQIEAENSLLGRVRELVLSPSIIPLFLDGRDVGLVKREQTFVVHFLLKK